VPILCWLKISVKGFRYGEKGFTLLEILLVILLLSILAAIVTANLSTFLTTGRVAAANTEVANVETAALAYYADNDETWPGSSDELAANDYLNDNALVDYGFDGSGRVTFTHAAAWGSHADVVWNATEHKWEPASE